MRLKALKKGDYRTNQFCQASRCNVAAPLTLFAAGVRFPKKDGDVALCDKHVAMSEPKEPPPGEDPKALINILAEPEDDTAVRMAAEAKEAEEILGMVEAFQIVTAEDMAFADECLGDVKTKLKELKKEKEGVTKPMNAALKKVRGWFKPAETFYGKAETAWKKRIAAWTQAQAEAQAKALEAVQEAHQAGDVQAVAEAMTSASQAQVELPANVTVRERWVVEIVDPRAVPPEYWSPDIEKIRGAVGEGLREIPGCNIFREDQVIRRGA